MMHCFVGDDIHVWPPQNSIVDITDFSSVKHLSSHIMSSNLYTISHDFDIRIDRAKFLYALV